MRSNVQTEPKGQAGFTLVELAIVLVIIGLLIGGILKGQELIAATRVNSTVSQIKAIDAATYTFVDTYGGLPGDLASANARLNGCSTNNGCVPAGSNTGNGRLENRPGITPGFGNSANTTEGMSFFIQLGVSELIGGISNPASVAAVTGQTLLASPLGASTNWRAGYETGDWLNGTDPILGGAALVNAHHLVLSSIDPANDMMGSTTSLDNAGVANKAASSIDTKMDDGAAGRGSVRGIGTACLSADSDTAVYTGAAGLNCSMMVRFYQ
jgi:prepilin-type N-terminal cleavage/methylation domain-containing protein